MPDANPATPRTRILGRLGCALGLIVVVGLAAVGGFFAYVAYQADTRPEFYAERLELPPERMASASRALASKLERLATWPPPATDGSPTDDASAAVETIDERDMPSELPTSDDESDSGSDLAEPPEDDGTEPAAEDASIPDDVPERPRWSLTLTEDELNAYLATRLDSDAPDLGQAGVRDPRVVLEPGRVRIAFRAERGDLAGVVSLTVRPTVTEDGPDAVQFEITEAHLGRVPLPIGTIAEQIPRPRLVEGVDVQWYSTDDGVTVEADWGGALDRHRGPTRHVDTVDVAEGRVTVGGFAETGERAASEVEGDS